MTRVRGREQLQEGQVAQPCGPLELAGGRLVRDDVVEGITSRVMRFQFLVRLNGSTGWNCQLLFQWPLTSLKLLNWFDKAQRARVGPLVAQPAVEISLR